MTANPKNPPLRDRAWLDHLHGERCVLTGELGNASETIDPMHIGAYKGMKRGDDEALPVMHRFHALAHAKGEVSMLRQHAPDDVIRAAFRALARERYREWKAKQ